MNEKGYPEDVEVAELKGFLFTSSFSMCSGLERQALANSLEELVYLTIESRDKKCKKAAETDGNDIDLSVGLNFDLLD
jgi:hypothetical protein